MPRDVSPMVRDPRVETLTSWARADGQLSGREVASLAALDSLPFPATAPALAYVASAAYGRVPGRGPCDIAAGNRIVRVLAHLGEAGARELLVLRDTVAYRHARRTIASALTEFEKLAAVPTGELEDEFAGVELDADLGACVPVGPYHAILGVTSDLQRVQTIWRDETGRESSRRPPRAAKLSEELDAVEDVRRRLGAHVTALRHRLERAMIAGESWTAEEWSARMFGDPPRAAMARRLIWRLERDSPVLVLPGEAGLHDVHGERVAIGLHERVALWHAADEPAAQDVWSRRLATLGVEQPIEQAAREVTLADPRSAQVSFAVGERVEQRPFRGFLRSRGWEVPYMGWWFFIGEASREVTRHGPIAVLEVDLDWEFAVEADVIRVGDLRFRSVLGAELDSRILPPAIVSEAARDVLGALAAATVRRCPTAQ